MPSGIKSSGFPAVEATCREIGIEFDPWQVDLNRCILAKDASGLYAADTVCISIPRQVGKTYDIGGLVFADCIINPGTTTVWTAHRFKVARETFNDLRAVAKSPLLAPHIDYDAITTAAGNECIPFRNGSRIVFAARERGAIRGFTKVRRLILDEAQILSEAALADLVPTMNQAENPQIVMMGTPPKPTDPAEAFTNFRREAMTGDAEGVIYVEFSADPDSDPADHATWRVANPSFPSRTPAKAILRMKKLLSPEDFVREALGVWDEDAYDSVIPSKVWAGLSDQGSKMLDPVAFGVDVSPDRNCAAIGVAGFNEDGRVQVELVQSFGGTDGLMDALMARLSDLTKHRYLAVTVDSGGPAASLIPNLMSARVKVFKTTAQDMKAACGSFYDGAMQGGLVHLADAELSSAVLAGTKRPLGDAWAWDRRSPSSDITPLVAVTLAAHGLSVKRKRSDQGTKAVIL